MDLPEGVTLALERLTLCGHEAYVVGGCVRDALMGMEPHDWDICTSALPQETMACFARERIIQTGLRHGTLTVLFGGLPIEVTTYRVDGTYTDGRHPDSVSFVRHLCDDLARRDFTINAMAYHPDKGIEDPFDGMRDLREKRIRCVGDARARLSEDGLRILRALRFASTLGFDVESETAEALRGCKTLLNGIAGERVRAELEKLLCGRHVFDVLQRFASVLGAILPEILPAIGFEQHNPHHCYDVFTHTLHAVANVTAAAPLRMTMLLHDLGKPHCFTLDASGIGHFYGHGKLSAEIAKDILSRLKYDNATRKRILDLVLYHDANLGPQRELVKRWLRRLGTDAFEALLDVKRADTLAQHPDFRQFRMEELARTQAVLDEIRAQGDCFRLADLALNGNDLLSAGIPPGPAMGRSLDTLLRLVTDGKLENDKAALLAYALEHLIPRI